MIAVTLAVAVAASIVEWQHIPHGQWVIWSAASIVTGDAASARKKLRDRLLGAFVGVPVGIVAGLLLPHDNLAVGMALLLTVLTLVALRHYPTAFGIRCGCAAFVLVALGQSAAAAGERAANVVLGGLVGIVFVLLVHAVARRRAALDQAG